MFEKIYNTRNFSNCLLRYIRQNERFGFNKDIPFEIKNESTLHYLIVKVQEIDALKWTSEAQTYWEECAESIKNIEQADELIPGVDYGVPMMDWECRYCGFTKYCKGV